MKTNFESFNVEVRNVNYESDFDFQPEERATRCCLGGVPEVEVYAIVAIDGVIIFDTDFDDLSDYVQCELEEAALCFAVAHQ